MRSPKQHIEAFLRAVERLPEELSREAKRSAISLITSSLRQTRAGGRPPIPTPCPKCGEACGGARAAQAHCRVSRAKKGRRKATAPQGR